VLTSTSQTIAGRGLCQDLSMPLLCRMDYCNSLLVVSPKYMNDRLQRIMNAAARLVSRTGKFDRGLQCISSILHNDLHWLDVPERFNYKLNVTMHRCLQEKFPRYLIDCCAPASGVAGCRQLCSASRQHLTVPPCYRLNTFGRLRAFSVAGPTWWNSLLRDPKLSSDSFRNNLQRNHLRVN